MAYPTSPITFTTKNTGDVVQASHVNDLQTEVAAIEAGLLNGTANLNSSNSTVSALSVTNGSTLTGAVTLGAGIASTASFASSVTFSSGVTFSTLSNFAARPVMVPPHMMLSFLDSTVTIGSSAASTLSFLADGIIINSSIHSTASNPDRMTPQSTGVYQVSGQVAFGTFASTGSVSVVIRDSSAANITAIQQNASSQGCILQVSGYKRFDVTGGYCNLIIGLSGQSTMSISTGIGNTWFAMTKL